MYKVLIVPSLYDSAEKYGFDMRPYERMELNEVQGKAILNREQKRKCKYHKRQQ